MIKKIPGLTDEQNRETAQAFIKLTQEAFYEDVAIWGSKDPNPQPAPV